MTIEQLRRRVYEIIEKRDRGDRASVVFNAFLVALIALNICAIVLESVASVRAAAGGLFRVFEIVSVAVFSLEYLLRVWTADLKLKAASRMLARLRYVFTPMALIDLLAVAPFYLPFLIPFDLRFLRILRLTRLLRLLKIQRYSNSLNLIGKVIKEKRSDLIVTLFMTVILLVFASTLMYYIESDVQPEEFPNIVTSFWWAIATLTTIGYGDVYPVTGWGKLLSGIIAILGIGLVALPTGILSTGFVEQLSRKRAMASPSSTETTLHYCPHCGKRLPQSLSPPEE